MLRALKPLLLETLEVVLIAMVIILPIRYFLVQPFFVRGQSMEPTFHDGDYLVIDEISYRFREPQRGEVVVFRFPGNPLDHYIKRLIGLPSETVQIQAGQVRISNAANPAGFILREDYLKPNMLTDGDLHVRLGPDEYFVLGDNRVASYDSRRWGVLEAGKISGRVWIRPWPIGQQFLIGAPNY